MIEIHQLPNVKVIDEIWVGMSEDEDMARMGAED